MPQVGPWLPEAPRKNYRPIVIVGGQTSTIEDERRLEGTALDDSGALAVLDGTALGAGSLKSLDDVQRLLVGNLAEDDVAAVEPRGNDGGDEELGAVAAKESDRARLSKYRGRQRVRRVSTYVLGPALAMESRPGLSCFSWKFSSANFSP